MQSKCCACTPYLSLLSLYFGYAISIIYSMILQKNIFHIFWNICLKIIGHTVGLCNSNVLRSLFRGPFFFQVFSSICKTVAVISCIINGGSHNENSGWSWFFENLVYTWFLLIFLLDSMLRWDKPGLSKGNCIKYPSFLKHKKNSPLFKFLTLSLWDPKYPFTLSSHLLFCF
jgi:hypothetical protein